MRHWIGVASANHVARGHAGGYMQVCHGKAGPLRRLSPGDGIVYYSPGVEFGASGPGNRCQSFTALGSVRDNIVYSVDMGAGFVPFRRDVDWLSARSVSILPLLDRLEFTRGKSNWGYAFRFGLLEISSAEMLTIAEAMGAQYPPALSSVPELQAG